MLNDGVDFPKERRQIDLWVDAEIEREKTLLLITFNNNMLDHYYLLTYTQRIAYLIGQHNKGGLMDAEAQNNENEPN